QYHAYNGTSKFKDAGAFKGLRAVFSVHPEPVTIVARADAGIKHLDDIKGKRLNIGNPGSGTRGTWEVLEEALGWKRSDLKLASELKSAEMSQALCDNKIDVYFWLVGHPSGSTKEAMTTCDAVLVTATGPVVDKLVSDNSFYRTATIPGGMYRGNPDDVQTYGVGATFVSSTATSTDTIYQVVKAVFENFDAFKKLHPAFKNLKESEMIKDGLSAPLHDGAAKYYKEKGWM
ncbi:MAG: TAXI family TRAP transporter solute-binding subunit, partial [Gammaproteobacteria bacterium]|nr:TAXI family TRAP transporter solute-binding subunit [Gammaproteobacteria bacterium]